jgi:3-phosphoshikimate 1-carboxyvinyltransferase
MKELLLPWSKSITNRCFILWALASGETKLRGILESNDTKVMMEALQELWFNIKKDWNGVVSILWWIDTIKSRISVVLDGNESGTSVRFLTGLAILFTDKINEIVITGSERMCQRPIQDLSGAISQLWIDIQTNNGCPPVKVTKKNQTREKCIHKIKMNGTTSSQYFTTLLQIWWMLPEWLEIEVEWDLVSKPYIDITLHELEKFWVKVLNDNYKFFKVEKQQYKSIDTLIEWDASALSYIALYILLHGGELQIKNLWDDTKQWDYKFLDILKLFWLNYSSDWKTTTIKSWWIKDRDMRDYRNIDIDFSHIPDVSLTFMVLSVLLPWGTKLRGLQTLNLKECRRIDAMASEIKKLWIDVQHDEESMSIWELDIKKERKNVDIETYNDHRIAMSFAILNSYIWWLNILDKKCVNKTYPNFWKDLEVLSNQLK